jgi:hypothetical protein
VKTTAVVIAFAAAALAGSLARAQPTATPTPGARPAVRQEAPPPQRAGLLWEEKWRQNANGSAEAPVSLTASVRNPDLELKMYGPGPALSVLGKDADANNPPHVFSGEAKGPMAVAWRNRKAYADLTGLSRIRVATKMSGLHKLYPIVKLADGDWYLADWPTSSLTKDWVTEEIPLTEARWIKLDIANVVTKGNLVDRIDLSKVDEIGFADLIPASGHGPGGWFDLGEVDVYGKAVPR